MEQFKSVAPCMSRKPGSTAYALCVKQVEVIINAQPYCNIYSGMWRRVGLRRGTRRDCNEMYSSIKTK